MNTKLLPTILLAAAACACAACAPAQAGNGTDATVIDVSAADYSFTAPDTVRGGLVIIRTHNHGAEIHHTQLLRLDSGRTIADLASLQGEAMPTWVRQVGGPGVAAPGASAAVTLDLAPGRYALICFIPSPDGRPHYTKGMLRGLEVLPAAAPATPPASDVVMVLDDYRFELSGALRRGPQTIEITNAATQAHEFVLAKLEPGTSALDFVQWFFSGAQGSSRGRWIGGTVGLDRGERNWLTVDLEPGTYALLCFLPDAADGRMHIEHGMAREVVVN